jgi:FkbM family methyltransferase
MNDLDPAGLAEAPATRRGSREHLGAGVVGRLTRRLPARRTQTAYWLGKLLVPREPFVGRFQGGLMEVHPGEVASTTAFFTGVYEREVTIWSLRQLENGPPALVVDVGANFGYYPLLFGLLSGGATETIAFEPDPENFAWLSRNLALNLGLRATAVQAAVGDVDGGTISFGTPLGGYSMWARVAGMGGSDKYLASKLDVPTTTLDGDLDARGVGAVPLTLIDVEGYEAHVIQGMSRGIANGRYEAVVVEFHPWAFPDPEAEMERMADRFLAAGYSGYRFRRYTGPHCDKDAAYYRLRWDDSLLGPLTFDNLDSWEHYLFSIA